jgi:DNA-binding response OmpR family regulator
MSERLCRLVILDTEPDRLIALQRVFEEADLDATITWDETEACQLLGTGPFDLVLIGDHPPELDAAAIIDDFSFRGTCPPVLILMNVAGGKAAEYFRRLGAAGVVPKRDPQSILEHVRKALTPTRFKRIAPRTSPIRLRSWRTAS